MMVSKSAIRWWHLSLAVLFAGVLLPLFGITAHASAVGWSGAAAVQAGQPAAEQSDEDGEPGDARNGGNEFKGRVQAMPAENELVGAWTISGKVYNVTAQTEIKQKFGAFVAATDENPGTCVVGKMSADGTYIRELESQRAVVCKNLHGDDSDDQAHGEVYGKLAVIPDGFKGEWYLEGLEDKPFIANDDTELDEKNGPFEPGEYVKIEFVVLQDGTFLAKEIKSVNVAHDDDNGHGRGEIEHQAVAFGVIGGLPGGMAGPGVWTIGGITYNVTSLTVLDPHHGAFVQGMNVRVKYYVDEDGSRVAKHIKSMPPAAGGYAPWDLKLVGFITELPDTTVTFVGTWVVGGVSLVADENSKFDEDDPTLIKGAYVKVKYRLVGETRLIVEMKTRVMPGGGDDNHIGKVEQMDDSMATWRIGGHNYVVTDATLVGNVATGDTVLVNSYTDAAGAQVATRIIDVTLDNLLFLPAAYR
jgi:hypothetical protein